MYIKQNSKLHALLKGYQDTQYGYWLRLFAWSSIKLYKVPFKKQGIFTACYIVPLNGIFIAPDNDNRVLFGVICHQLYHAYQRDRMGALKYLLFKAFKRSKLQLPAQVAQMNAVQWACTQNREEFDIWEI